MVDGILIDDDPWVREDWTARAKTHGKSIVSTSSLDELRSILPSLPRDIPVFIDVELGNGVQGEDVAVYLGSQGFSHLFFTTAHHSLDAGALSKVKGVVGKEPPSWFVLSTSESSKLTNEERRALLESMSGEQRIIFEQRMRQYEDALYGVEGASWLDGIGTYYPDAVLDVWERAIYESLDETDLKERIQTAWRKASKA